MKIERMQFHDSYFQHPGVRNDTKKARLAESTYAVDPEAKKDDQPTRDPQADHDDTPSRDASGLPEELVTAKGKTAEGSLDIVV